MKKLVFLVCLIFLALNHSTTVASDLQSGSGSPVVAENREVELSGQEIALIEMRVIEIRDMDKSELTAEERLELRKELKERKKQAQRRGGVYISLVTLILVIILIILVR
jgi:hypothetical protein